MFFLCGPENWELLQGAFKGEGLLRLHPRLCVRVLLLKFSRQRNLGGGGSPLDLGLKVSGYHGEFGKKRKKIAPGVHHCAITANVKKCRFRHL